MCKFMFTIFRRIYVNGFRSKCSYFVRKMVVNSTVFEGKCFYFKTSSITS